MATKTEAKASQASHGRASSNGQPGRKELEGLQTAGKTELQQEMIELRAKGWSIRKIADQLQVGKSTVVNWLAELEEEIATRKAIELDALYETAYMNKEARITLLAGQLEAIQQEITKRGLEDVPTDRLLRLQLEYLQALEEERIEPRPLTDRAMAELKALRQR